MILIVSQHHIDAERISVMLADQNYPSEILPSIAVLDSSLERKDVLAVFIDIDSVPVDNRCIRTLTLKRPSSSFFCLSSDTFHPELQDAICYHIYACLNKPIDREELIYWLRCIDNQRCESRGPPRGEKEESLDEGS